MAKMSSIFINKLLHTGFYTSVLLLFFVASSCSGVSSPTPDLGPVEVVTLTAPPLSADESSSTTGQSDTSSSKVDDELSGTVTVGPDCRGDEVNPIAQTIAEDYEFTTYKEVMTWFCNGAEFEDILVALETEEISAVPAEEMLRMLADGFTWEDIWLLIGVIE